MYGQRRPHRLAVRRTGVKPCRWDWRVRPPGRRRHDPGGRQALMPAAEAAGVPCMACTFHNRCVPSLLVDGAGGGRGRGLGETPELLAGV